MQRANNWSAIRRQLADWPKPALLALVKDLHNASPENPDFLRARFATERAGGAALEGCRHKIAEQFFPARSFGKLKLAVARKAIRDCQQSHGRRREHAGPNTRHYRLVKSVGAAYGRTSSECATG